MHINIYIYICIYGHTPPPHELHLHCSVHITLAKHWYLPCFLHVLEVQLQENTGRISALNQLHLSSRKCKKTLSLSSCFSRVVKKPPLFCCFFLFFELHKLKKLKTTRGKPEKTKKRENQTTKKNKKKNKDFVFFVFWFFGCRGFFGFIWFL